MVEVLSGLAPNYATFLILRALFGIGMGGEWGVGASLAMEKVPRALARRPVRASCQEGYAGRLSPGRAVLPTSSFPRWGWRPMFFIGGLPALLALVRALRVQESAVWEKTRHESWGTSAAASSSQWRALPAI